MASQEEFIDLSDDEADMLTRMRESKLDPKTVAAAKEPPKEDPPKKEPVPKAEAPSIEERVTKATKAAVEDVKRQATYDQQSVDNRGAMNRVIEADPAFAGIASQDKQVYGDVEVRVSEALKEPESIEKIKTMSRAEYLDHIASLTADVLTGMKERLGIKDPNENLDARLAGGSTGVGGAGTRRSGSGTGKEEKDPAPIEFGQMSRDEAFPTQAEIEARHDTRVTNMIKKGEL